MFFTLRFLPQGGVQFVSKNQPDFSPVLGVDPAGFEPASPLVKGSMLTGHTPRARDPHPIQYNKNYSESGVVFVDKWLARNIFPGCYLSR